MTDRIILIIVLFKKGYSYYIYNDYVEYKRKGICTMNKIYKVIWSKVKACYVVVSELAKRHSKCKSAKPAISLAALVTAFMLTAGHGVVYATDLAPTDNVGKIGAITIDSSKVNDSKFNRIVNIDGFIIDNSVQNDGTFSQYMQIGKTCYFFGSAGDSLYVDCRTWGGLCHRSCAD